MHLCVVGGILCSARPYMPPIIVFPECVYHVVEQLRFPTGENFCRASSHQGSSFGVSSGSLCPLDLVM